MLRLTREQVREIDRRAIEDFHIPGIVLMENAARAIVDVALQMLPPVKGPAVHVVCGGGNNGGDGFAVARHLQNRGIDVTAIAIFDPGRLKGDAATNWKIIKAMKIPIEDEEKIAVQPADLIIDALFGTGLQAAPRDAYAIRVMNESRKPVLAIDLPSGLDCDSGLPFGECVRATRTVTFVAEKAGFANPASKQFTGEITVGCIGCPRELIEEVAKMTPT
jgi:NAD(P)H-hydrate epimerase